MKREDDSSRLLILWGEDGEAELAQSLAVADDFDVGDLVVCEGEAEYA
jgi:hypothetical protein